MSGTINYNEHMHQAMRALVRNVLTEVERKGLPGDHHFFITFDASHPDVTLADWLRSRYPDDMTVVVQHWYEDLSITEDGFGITLNFGDQPEHLYIPFDSIRTFVDPSVEFGLRFEEQTERSSEQSETSSTTSDEAPMHIDDQDGEAEQSDSSEPAQVVQLDTFRRT